MTSAAVGFQCPECIKEGAASVREARTVAGGRIPSSDGLVTRIIVAVTVGVFVLQLLTGGVNGTLTRTLELVGVEVASGEYYRLLTVMVVHAGILHILLNMYALWIMGPTLERWLGRLRFASLYVLSGLAGGVASYLFNSPVQPSVGASGAIFGVFGAVLVVARRMHFDVRGLVALIVINLLLPVVLPGAIDWRAHLGGLAAGILVGAVFVYPPATDAHPRARGRVRGGDRGLRRARPGPDSRDQGRPPLRPDRGAAAVGVRPEPRPAAWSYDGCYRRVARHAARPPPGARRA